MKRVLSILFSALILLSLSVNVSAASVEYNGYLFENVKIGEETGVKITGFNGKIVKGDVIIPSSAFINGSTKTVLQIADSALSDCNITSVEIPSSVKKVGKKAFCNCINLTQVIFQTGSAASVGNNCFENCISLKKAVLPSGMETIPDYCFYGCVSLNDCTIPDSVKYINKYAFYCCGFSSVSVPASVVSIGNRAFSNNKNCTSFSVDSGNTEYCTQNGVLYSADKKTLYNYPLGRSDTSFSVPSGTTELGEESFSFAFLKKVVLPSSVTMIDTDAFKSAENLTDVSLPGNIKQLGCGAFSNCSSLKSITIPSSLNTANSFEEAFYNSGLESVVLEQGVTEISDHAFELCMNLSSVQIPASVKRIGTAAFSKCYKLKEIYLPDNISETGNVPFEYCDDIKIFINEGTVTESTLRQKNIDFVLNEKPVDPPVINTPVITVPGSANIKWRYHFRVTASVTDMPSGYHLVWYYGNSPVKVGDKDVSVLEYYEKSEVKTDKIYTVKVVDSNGSVLKVNDKPVEKQLKITVDDSIITKIISFFVCLFSLNETTI